MSPRAARITAVRATKIAPQKSEARTGGQRIRRVTSPRQLDPVADAGLRDDQLRTRRIDFDLAPQVGDVDAEILLRVAELAAPHGVEDLLVGEGAARLADEGPHDVPFQQREMERASPAPDRTTGQVDRHGSGRHPAIRPRAGEPAA